MANKFKKLDQALKDLIEAYTEVSEDLDEKHSDDDDAYASALIETLESSIESALEEHDSSTNFFASMLGSLEEALEQLDPSAFEEEEGEEEEEEDYKSRSEDDVDLDYDEDENEDLDLDEDD